MIIRIVLLGALAAIGWFVFLKRNRLPIHIVIVLGMLALGGAAVLFPEHPVMPPGCTIKGKLAVRARVTGNVGVYHLQGCRSYPGTTEPDRWFCTEEDAQAAGFRKAYNCRAKRK